MKMEKFPRPWESLSAQRDSSPQGLTLRSVVLGLAGVTFLCSVTPHFDLYMQGSRIVCNHLPIGVIVLLIVLLGINVILARLGRALSQAEIGYSFCMMLVASAIPSLGCATYIVTILAGPYRFATLENNWEGLFHRYLSPRIAPTDQKAIDLFHEGLGGSGTGIPWDAWIVPLIWWGMFIGAMYVTMISMASLFRKQWEERERLTFPLMQVPMSLITGGRGLFRNPAFWVGCAIPFLLHSYNSIGFYIPSVPAIEIASLRLGIVSYERPWIELNNHPLHILPSVIGVTYLLSTEVSMSFWFFHLFYTVERLIFSALGLGTGGHSSLTIRQFCRGQEQGAFAFLVLFLCWAGRKHFVDCFKRALRWRSQKQEENEPLPARWSVLGLVAGTLVMVLWSMAMGSSFLTSFAFLLVFYVVVITLSRLVCAAGILWVECSYCPTDVMVNLAGTGPLPGSAMTPLFFQQSIFMFSQEYILLPSLMNSVKLSSMLGMNKRHLTWVIVLALGLAVPLSIYSAMNTVYTHGASYLDQGICQNQVMWTFNKLSDHISRPRTPDVFSIFSMGLGASLMGALMLLHRRFLWWPIYPLAYVMGSTWSLGVLWFSCLIGWLIRSAVQKVGGTKGQRELRPAFIGLIVGEFVTAGIWMAIDWFTGSTLHNIFPGEV